MDGHATQAAEVADGDVGRQRAPVRRDAGNGGEVANLRFNLPSDENIAILTVCQLTSNHKTCSQWDFSKRQL